MRKIAIVTLSDFNNYGNRLQNYALEKVLKNEGHQVVSLVDYRPNYLKTAIKILLNRNGKSIQEKTSNILKLKNFLRFDKNNVNTFAINNSNFEGVSQKQYDCFVAGSDQIWNPDWAQYTYGKMFLRFCPPKKRIAYAASFGVDTIPDQWVEKYKVGVAEFHSLSVREDRAVEIIRFLTGNYCDKVLDPTMLLSRDDWNKVRHVPRKAKENSYILTYFLGGKTSDMEKVIEEYARRFQCKVINLLEIGDTQYSAGPAEFIGLISKAKLVLTDSFHATVFSIIYERPFIVYERKGKGSMMGSRISSLLNMCGLLERKAEKINEDQIFNISFIEAQQAIVREKNHSLMYLKNAIKCCRDGVD